MQIMEVPIQEIPKDHEKKGKLTHLYRAGKYKIMASFYNLVRSMPSEVPPLSDSPLYLSGVCYKREDPQRNGESKNEILHSKISDNDYPHHTQNFLVHFGSLFWFCYRKGFAPLEPSQLTTDIGWGCMLRSGQMIVGHVLLRHSLGPEWRLNDTDQLSPFSSYRQILRWFSDTPSQSSPYSIHNLVWRSKVIDMQAGNNITKVGEWFTPARVCQILK